MRKTPKGREVGGGVNLYGKPGTYKYFYRIAYAQGATEECAKSIAASCMFSIWYDHGQGD